jgi:hypothetical protein
MKKLIFLIGIMLMSLSGMAQYPIKTIFKGDSVIILTIKQSEGINKAIERNSRQVKENVKKIQELEMEINRLQSIIVRKDSIIDTLYSEINDCNTKIETNSIADSLWKWALGPTLIYTQYPDDDNVYLFDLSRYYMTTDDFGIMMAKMNDRDYKRYKEFIETYGLDEKAIWKFKNEMNVEYLSKSKMEEKRVWKYKRKKKEN